MIDTVDLVIEDDRWSETDLAPLAETATTRALEVAGIDVPVEVALLATSDARMAELNREFRGKDRATNVLSWPAFDLAPGAAPPEDRFGRPGLGDIALGYETCAAEARAADRPFGHHVAHLVVHGCLHLLGYDHENEADATEMEELEVRALASMGIPTPY